MDSLFVNLKGVGVFQGEIIVTGENHNHHMKKLNLVFKILENAGLKVNFEKCNFFEKEVVYLGFIINKDGVHPSPEKLASIEKFPLPKNINLLWHMSTILNPICNLLKLNLDWLWNKDCEEAFLRIKQHLKSADVLVHFKPRLEVRLTVDASAVGIGLNRNSFEP